MKQEAPVIYVWFAESDGAERNGEQFIRAWTHDPARVDGLRNAIGKEPTIYSAILQAATRDGFEAQFIAEHGHRLAALFGINAFDLADRDAQIMAVLAATRDTPSADAVDAQRYRFIRSMKSRHLDALSYRSPELIDAYIDEAIAASAPKGDGND